jgi:hypothetical protein
MRRLALHLLVGVSTFSSGIVLSAVTTRHAEKLIGPLDGLTSSISAESLQRIGGMDACGPKANFHTWDLSDGTRIWIECLSLASSARARSELEKRVSGPTEIIERQPQLGPKGQTVGERVVFRSVGSVTVVEVYGNNLCVTEAASLDHLRWYEGK